MIDKEHECEFRTDGGECIYCGKTVAESLEEYGQQQKKNKVTPVYKPKGRKYKRYTE